MTDLRHLQRRSNAIGAKARDTKASIWQVCVRHLWEKNVTAMSAALSFRTIFALVPLLVLAFLLLKTAGILENSKDSLRRVLEASGFSQLVLVETTDSPATTSSPDGLAGQRTINVADEIERLVDRVEQTLTIGRVGPVGFLLLIYTATTLLTSMERSLNRIFGAERSRSLVRRLPLYWSVMTLGPILVTAGIFVGRQATETLESTTGLSRIVAGLVGWPAPFFAGLLVLWAIYKLLPNIEVPWQSALIGAAAATPVWLIARWAFALYVSHFVRNGNLYGVLGLLPLFLVWLNLSWLVVLFGAELASLAAESRRASRPKRGRGAGLRPSDLLAALLAIGGPYEQGRGAVSARQVSRQLRITSDAAGRLLDVLLDMRLIYAVGDRSDSRYVLARPAGAILIIELMQVPISDEAELPTSYAPAIASALGCFHEQTRSSLASLSLADLLTAGRRDVIDHEAAEMLTTTACEGRVRARPHDNV